MGTFDEHVICIFHKLKRSWQRITSRRLGSYSTFSTNASNSRPTSSVDTPLQRGKNTTKLKFENCTKDKFSAALGFSTSLWWLHKWALPWIFLACLLGLTVALFPLFLFFFQGHFHLYKVFHCSKTLDLRCCIDLHCIL